MESKYTKKMKKHAHKHAICDECSQNVYYQGAWTSVKLGLFLCQECAGIHRGLGTHISFVKSVSLDKWNRIHYRNFLEAKKKDLNAKLEAALPLGAKPKANTEHRLKRQFIKNKHVRKLYFKETSLELEDEDEISSNPEEQGEISKENSEPFIQFADFENVSLLETDEFDICIDPFNTKSRDSFEFETKNESVDIIDSIPIKGDPLKPIKSQNESKADIDAADKGAAKDDAISDIMRMFQHRPTQQRWCHRYDVFQQSGPHFLNQGQHHVRFSY